MLESRRFAKAARAIVILPLLAAGPLVVRAQPEWKLRASLLHSEASYLADKGEHQSALALFSQAFDLDPLSRTHCFDAISCALAVGDTALANSLLSMGVQHGFDPKLYSGANDLQEHLRGPRSIGFRSRWQADRAVFAASCDSALIDAVEALHDADQAARRGKDYTKETRRIDSLNFEKLITLVEQHGFLTERLLGHSTGSVQLLLWHQRAPHYPNSSQWQRLLPHIRIAIANGDLSPSYLCAFDDHAAQEANEPMPYGTLIGYFRNYLDTIKLPARDALNARRRMVGLGPIEWDAAMLGIPMEALPFGP